MGPTPKQLAEFRQWLLDGGAADGTVRLYLLNVQSCYRDGRGVTGRLLDKNLAPKTRHTNLAALVAWATHREDEALLKTLRRISLPPAQRTRPKIPVDLEVWQALIQRVRSAPWPRPAMRAALLLICMRGLRCSDVLRLRRREVAEALKTGKLVGEAKGGKRIEYAAAPIREALEILADQPAWTSVIDLIVTPRSKVTGHERWRYAVQLLERALARVAREALAEGVHPHRMRRTYATTFVQRLQNDPRALLKLQDHMGWSQMTTAAQYVDAIQRDELHELGESMMAEIAGAPPAAAPKAARKR